MVHCIVCVFVSVCFVCMGIGAVCVYVCVFGMVTHFSMHLTLVPCDTQKTVRGHTSAIAKRTQYVLSLWSRMLFSLSFSLYLSPKRFLGSVCEYSLQCMRS